MLLARLLLAAATAASPSPSPSDAPTPVPTPAPPACVTVSAKLLGTIDTKVTYAGERFTFATTGVATYNGKDVPAGTQGSGVVQSYDQSKSHGHSGYLILEARYIELADGSHVPVSFVPGGDGRSTSYQRAGSSNSFFGLGYIPYVSTAASIYDYFHHGKDAALVAGTVFPITLGDGFVDGTCALKAL